MNHAAPDDDQVRSCVGSSGVTCGAPSAAKVFTSVFPEKVHRSSTPGRSGHTRVLSSGLSRRRTIAPRMVRPSCRIGSQRSTHLFSALQSRTATFKKTDFERLLQHTVCTARQKRLIRARPQVIGDSTGYEVGHTSFYFRSRRGKRKFYVPRWPKLSACVDLDSHLIVSACISIGPSRDTVEAAAIVRKAHRRVHFRRVIWDGGCDSETFHELVRDELKAHSLVPIKSGTKTRKWPPTKYRRQMKRRFFKRLYGQRWQIESAFSRHKRRLSSSLRAKTWSAQQSEAYMRIVVHNLMILRMIDEVFNRASRSHT